MKKLITARILLFVVLTCGFIVFPLWHLRNLNVIYSKLGLVGAVVIVDPRVYVFAATLLVHYVMTGKEENASPVLWAIAIWLLSLGSSVLVYFVAEYSSVATIVFLLNAISMSIFLAIYTYCLSKVFAYSYNIKVILLITIVLFLMLPLIEVALLSFWVIKYLAQAENWEIATFWVNLIFSVHLMIIYTLFTKLASMWHNQQIVGCGRA